MNIKTDRLPVKSMNFEVDSLIGKIVDFGRCRWRRNWCVGAGAFKHVSPRI